MPTTERVNSDSFVLPDFQTVAEESATLDTTKLVELGPGDPLPASAAAVALALWRDRSVATADVKAAAERRVAQRQPQLHTFVPLYTTNYCDSECKMCAMRKSNTALSRRFAGKKEIEEQLDILYEHEGVRGVGFLTGEYADPYVRLTTAFRIGWAARTALDKGFERVYFNIGSMTGEEIAALSDWLEPGEPVTMCVFQETYDRMTYRKFMGDEESTAPKADYERRISSFDRWIDAGQTFVNPGFLVGLHRSVEEELVNLVSHAAHLAARGATVDLSMPRLRPAMGVSNKTRTSDDDYIRLLASVAFSCPEQRLVLTNREDTEVQDAAIRLAGVMSPGSPDVSPYRRDTAIVNEEDSSQFLVADLRSPRDILGRLVAQGNEIALFDAVPAPSAV